MRATVLTISVASLSALVLLGANASRAARTGEARGPQTAQRSDSGSTLGAVTDTIRFGGRTIAAGDTVRGPVVVGAGDLVVRGVILGSAITIAGDIIVEPMGRITGDAVSVFGSIESPRSAIGGAAHTVTGSFGSKPTQAAPPRRLATGGALQLSLGWLVVVLLVGIGVLVFATPYLAGVSDVLEQRFWRSLLVGFGAELAILPGLALLIVALCVTVVGILLIPFAVVLYMVAIAGLGTLGFLAMALVTGQSMGRGTTGEARGAALRSLLVGIGLYLGTWVVAALFQSMPLVSGILRSLALAITFAAATAGFGAAILSRGGTRRDAATKRVSEEMAVWQTPTPVTGVVAARRPTPAVVPKQRG